MYDGISLYLETAVSVLKHNLSKLITVMIAALAAVTAYVILHELGHLSVSLACGAKITEFSILHGRVKSLGGAFTPFREELFYLAGTLLPYSVFTLFVLSCRKEIRSGMYHFFSFFAGLISASSFSAWAVLPFLYIRHRAPAYDDVTKFLDIFTRDHPALLVSAVSLLPILFSIRLIMKKDLPRQFLKSMGENSRGDPSSL